MRKKILETLNRKQKLSREIDEWFKKEYNSTTSAETLAEWEKNKIAVTAQIKVLLFLLSGD